MNFLLKSALFISSAVACFSIKPVLANPYNLDKIPLGYWQYYERNFKTPVVYYRSGNKMEGRMGNTCFSAQIGVDRVQVKWWGEVPSTLSNNYSLAAFTVDNINFQQIGQGNYQQDIGYCNSARKIYQGRELNFSFTYPSNYVLVENRDNNSSLDITLWGDKDYRDIQSGVYDRSELPLRSISISVYPNSNNRSPLEWARNNNNISNFSSTFRKGEHKNINLAGQTAISYTWCGLGCGDNIIFTSKDNKYIFLLDVVYGDESGLYLVREDFKYIISTFKFN